MPSKMASRSITKRELQKFLEKEVAPHFGPEWYAGPHCTLQRCSGYFVQGFSLFGLLIGPFRVYLFNQLLVFATPEEGNITLSTLRERKARISTASWISRFIMPKEIWIEWDKRFDELERMVTLIRSQLEPRYDHKITLDCMLNLIGKEPQKNENYPKIWARAVIRGLLGDMQFARQSMEELINMFSATADKFKAMGEKSYRSRIEVEVQRKNKAIEMLEFMINEKVFHDYIRTLTERSRGQICP